jgi:anti-sigma B factor antagonist
MNIKISSRQLGDVSVLDVAGRVNLGEEANAFRDALNDLISRHAKKIVVNLAEVSFLDSWGIRELATAFNSLTKDGGQLKVANPAKRVKDILRITRIDTVIGVFDDEAAALASFT